MSKRNMKLDQLYLGDCLDLLAGLPDDSVDLIISSPPYNIGKEYENRSPLNAYLDEQKVVLTECYRVLKNQDPYFGRLARIQIKEH